MPAPAKNKAKVVGWQKTTKVKARVAKKRAGVAKKHKEVAKLVSGARTGKAQKKLARKQKIAEKERAALEEAVKDVEMQDTKVAKKSGKQQQQQQGAAAGAADQMQE